MTKTMGVTLAASIALFAMPVFAEELSATDARDRMANAEKPGDGGSAPQTRSDASTSGDRPYGTDVQAPGAGSGEPGVEAAAREKALQAEQERQFVERIWTGP